MAGGPRPRRLGLRVYDIVINLGLRLIWYSFYEVLI
jgi:hypothetical protein